jgi:hypothetical protein
MNLCTVKKKKGFILYLVFPKKPEHVFVGAW